VAYANGFAVGEFGSSWPTPTASPLESLALVEFHQRLRRWRVWLFDFINSLFFKDHFSEIYCKFNPFFCFIYCLFFLNTHTYRFTYFKCFTTYLFLKYRTVHNIFCIYTLFIIYRSVLCEHFQSSRACWSRKGYI